jgi:hydrogenase nickel incorporation protein HypA/HybF
VHRIEAVARDAVGQHVAGVNVWPGALSQMSETHFREHFAREFRGAVAEGADLTVEVSDDPMADHARSVALRSVELQV